MSPLAEAYGASAIRHRRTKAEMAEIRDGLLAIVEADAPMTVRQVFYRAVVAGLIEKTEADYQKTVARLLRPRPRPARSSDRRRPARSGGRCHH